MVAGQPLEALGLQGKAMLEEAELEQFGGVTLSEEEVAVEQVPLEFLGHHLQVKAAQGFVPQ
jgi:hypothetical protein